MSDIPYTFRAREVYGGVDLTIEATDGMRLYPVAEMSGDGTRCVLHLRDYNAPRVGSRVCVHKMLIKVAAVRFDDSGRCMVRDEDTGAWLSWEGR